MTSRIHSTMPPSPDVMETSRLQISPELQVAALAAGSVATSGEIAGTPGRITGDLIDGSVTRRQAEREAMIEARREVLVPGHCRFLYTDLHTHDNPGAFKMEAQKIGAEGGPTIDVTDLFQYQSPLIRTKPSTKPGSTESEVTTWKIEGVHPSGMPDQPPRVTVYKRGATGAMRSTSIGLDTIMTRPQGGKSWRLPDPT